jgi:hypothetical protein
MQGDSRLLMVESEDLEVFSAQMRERRGWDIAKSGGWGSDGGSFSMRVRRSDLTQTTDR